MLDDKLVLNTQSAEEQVYVPLSQRLSEQIEKGLGVPQNNDNPKIIDINKLIAEVSVMEQVLLKYTEMIRLHLFKQTYFRLLIGEIYAGTRQGEVWENEEINRLTCCVLPFLDQELAILNGRKETFLLKDRLRNNVNNVPTAQFPVEEFMDYGAGSEGVSDSDRSIEIQTPIVGKTD